MDCFEDRLQERSGISPVKNSPAFSLASTSIIRTDTLWGKGYSVLRSVRRWPRTDTVPNEFFPKGKKMVLGWGMGVLSSLFDK